MEIENKSGKTIEIISDYDDEVIKPYIQKLSEWAEIWDYDAVDNWLPTDSWGCGGSDMFILGKAKEGFFKVHNPDLDDFEGLFGGKYSDAPEPLEGWEDENIHMEIYWKISKEEYAELKEKYEKSINT